MNGRRSLSAAAKPALAWGRWYPTGYVVALMADPRQAERAVAALAEAGFPDEGIGARRGEQILEYIEGFKRQDGRVQRTVGQFQERLSHEGEVAKRYGDAAARGEAVVAAYAEADERVEAARRVLAVHGAHDLQYFGRLTVTQLSNTS